MTVRSDQVARRGLKRLSAIAVVGLTLAGAAAAQAAPPYNAFGTGHGASTSGHWNNGPAGGDSGHRVH